MVFKEITTQYGRETKPIEKWGQRGELAYKENQNKQTKEKKKGSRQSFHFLDI